MPFIKIEQFFSLIPFDFAEYFAVFFSEAYSVFATSLIIGLVLIGVGVAMKFFGVGFKISKFFPTGGKKVKVVEKKVVKKVSK